MSLRVSIWLDCRGGGFRPADWGCVSAHPRFFGDGGRHTRDSPSCPVYSHLSLTLQLYTVIPVRAAGDCRPYHWTVHGPPFCILYIFYTVKFISRRDTQSHAEKSPFYILYIFYTVK